MVENGFVYTYFILFFVLWNRITFGNLNDSDIIPIDKYLIVRMGMEMKPH